MTVARIAPPAGRQAGRQAQQPVSHTPWGCGARRAALPPHGLAWPPFSPHKPWGPPCSPGVMTLHPPTLGAGPARLHVGPVLESWGSAQRGTEPGWNPAGHRTCPGSRCSMAQPGTAWHSLARGEDGSHLGAERSGQPLCWEWRPRTSHRIRRAGQSSARLLPAGSRGIPAGSGGCGEKGPGSRTCKPASAHASELSQPGSGRIPLPAPDTGSHPAPGKGGHPPPPIPRPHVPTPQQLGRAPALCRSVGPGGGENSTSPRG